MLRPSAPQLYEGQLHASSSSCVPNPGFNHGLHYRPPPFRPPHGPPQGPCYAPPPPSFVQAASGFMEGPVSLMADDGRREVVLRPKPLGPPPPTLRPNKMIRVGGWPEQRPPRPPSFADTLALGGGGHLGFGGGGGYVDSDYLHPYDSSPPPRGRMGGPPPMMYSQSMAEPYRAYRGPLFPATAGFVWGDHWDNRPGPTPQGTHTWDVTPPPNGVGAEWPVEEVRVERADEKPDIRPGVVEEVDDDDDEEEEEEDEEEDDKIAGKGGSRDSSSSSRPRSRYVSTGSSNSVQRFDEEEEDDEDERGETSRERRRASDRRHRSPSSSPVPPLHNSSRSRRQDAQGDGARRRHTAADRSRSRHRSPDVRVLGSRRRGREEIRDYRGSDWREGDDRRRRRSRSERRTTCVESRDSRRRRSLSRFRRDEDRRRGEWRRIRSPPRTPRRDSRPPKKSRVTCRYRDAELPTPQDVGSRRSDGAPSANGVSSSSTAARPSSYGSEGRRLLDMALSDIVAEGRLQKQASRPRKRGGRKRRPKEASSRQRHVLNRAFVERGGGRPSKMQHKEGGGPSSSSSSWRVVRRR